MVSGKEVQLDSAIQVVNRYVFVPVRMVSETFGAKVM
ncbi:stalk domain-containing protein [Paenibacillus chitinolyticus]